MYLPSAFHVTDEPEIEAFMQRHDFATMVGGAGGSLMATHIPVTVARTADGLHITGHVARANPHWQQMDGTNEALIIFHGPHAYVSPTWYATAPSVPTWNYAAVHAYGMPRVADNPAFLEEQLRHIAQRHEAGRDPQWSIDDLPSDYRLR